MFAIWQRTEHKFITDAIWRTNAGEATYRMVGGPCMQRRGCMRPPLICLDSWQLVQCILHGLMAIGRSICTYIEDSVENYLDSKGIAINKILKTCRVRWSLGKTPKPTGECTWRLMLHAWPLIAQRLGIVGTRANKSVEDMCWLLCHCYSTCENDEGIHHCQRVVAHFRAHIYPTSASHYLYSFEFVCPLLLPKLGKFGLGIFCQDSAESLTHLLKSIFLTLTNRGGSTQVDTTLAPGVADHFHRESLAMKQTLQYKFLYFFVPIIARNKT